MISFIEELLLAVIAGEAVSLVAVYDSVRRMGRKDNFDYFELFVRPGRFRGRRGYSATVEFSEYFTGDPLTLRQRYALRMSSAMLEHPGCLLYRCPSCQILTPVYFNRPEPGYVIRPDGTRVPQKPWRFGTGTICLWCGASISRGWLTGRRFVRRDDVPMTVPDDVMRRVVGDPDPAPVMSLAAGA